MLDGHCFIDLIFNLSKYVLREDGEGMGKSFVSVLWISKEQLMDKLILNRRFTT